MIWMLLALLLFGIATVFAWMFVQSLKEIVAYSNAKNISVYGRRYTSATYLYADFIFLNYLFNEQGIEEHGDVGLVEILKVARMRLRCSTFIPIVAFLFAAIHAATL